MGQVKCQITMSLDGYAAGPDQSTDDPLGKGGEQLHEWAYELDEWLEQHGRTGGKTNPSSAVLRDATQGVGAVVVGRGMFGGGPGPWSEDPSWDGWWGDEPPFHAPVFVLTHHSREPLEMKGGTVFRFVTDGADVALALAREAAGDDHVAIAGGAATVQQYLRAGEIDELWIHVAPVILGGGERLLDGLPPELRLEQTAVVEAPGVAHLKYRRAL